jgi:hypothetical protein
VGVEKPSDELWMGVKGQSNSEIARTPRNIFRYSVWMNLQRGRALIGLGGFTAYQTQTNSECAVGCQAVSGRVIMSCRERETTRSTS